MIRNYKDGFRTYTASGFPVSRKPICLGRALQQRNALLQEGDDDRSYSLSDSDIKQIIPSVKVITYPELMKYHNIDDALDEKGRLIVLYLTTSENNGHWCALLKSKDGKKIEWYDSYGGYKPDQEAEWLSKDKLQRFKQDSGYLTELLRNSPYKVVYNKFPFQSENSGVNTCGRWAATRLYFKHLTLPEFTKMALGEANGSGISLDDWVTRFTKNMIGK
jgi:hypothetical protein